MNDFFERPPRKEIRELNIVPIIDMLTVVIFFLLLSTTFIAFNKLTVPPSKVSTISNPVTPPPLSPKILLGKRGDQLKMVLSWAGKSPGEASETVSLGDLGSDFQARLVGAAKKMTTDFHEKYPEEKTIQLGLESGIEYQALVSAMDGVRDALPDIVLISYDEAEVRFARGGEK